MNNDSFNSIIKISYKISYIIKQLFEHFSCFKEQEQKTSCSAMFINGDG